MWITSSLLSIIPARAIREYWEYPDLGYSALTVPYAIGKGAFALGGAIVGGLGYVISGANFDTARSIWIPNIYGTYIPRPAHLRSEEPIHFLGKTDGGQLEPASQPIEPTPETSEPAKK